MILAIDTAAGLCAACIYDPAADAVRGSCVRDIGKGHAEQLMDVIDEALSAAGAILQDATRIAVSIGPGSFTGIRVGVAAARGFALALNVPAVGVATLDALAYEARAAHPDRPVIAALDARRDEIYLAVYDAGGTCLEGPRIASLPEALAAAGPDHVLAGTAAPLIAQAAGRRFDTGPVAATGAIATYARLGAVADPARKASPLYLRGPDARPQAGFALARKAKPQAGFAPPRKD